VTEAQASVDSKTRQARALAESEARLQRQLEDATREAHHARTALEVEKQRFDAALKADADKITMLERTLNERQAALKEAAAGEQAARGELLAAQQVAGSGVWGLGLGAWGLGLGVWGLGFGVWGLGFRV